jgi:hypothetical protein
VGLFCAFGLGGAQWRGLGRLGGCGARTGERGLILRGQKAKGKSGFELRASTRSGQASAREVDCRSGKLGRRKIAFCENVAFCRIWSHRWRRRSEKRVARRKARGSRADPAGRAVEFSAVVGIMVLLQDRAVMRKWDLARAARAEKVGFWAGNEGYFLFLGMVGGARARVGWSAERTLVGSTPER